MKINKPQHKSIIHSLFFKKNVNQNGQSYMEPIEIGFPDLIQASQIFEKIKKDTDEKGVLNNNEIEFTPTEVALIVKLFDKKQGWDVNVSTFVVELKKIIDGNGQAG